MDLGLRGKNVLVSGGSVGIGLAVAENFLKEGANVIIAARNDERLQGVVRDFQVKYPACKVWGKSADVSLRKDCEVLAAFAAEQGGVDIFISNAGAGSEEKCMDDNDDKWQHYWELHVMATIRLSRLLCPQMKERIAAGKSEEGVVIATTSMCATQPLYYEPIYNTTKAALLMYMKCLANEMIASKIRVMSIAPGLVMTPDWVNTATILSKQQGITVDEYFAGIASDMTPIGRYATTEEAAKPYIFLASPVSSYSLGANFHFDGSAMKVIS
jgi:NAD(P)-dependent dehydrogenase (short-subunit alcohol dehydrogenase family)